MTSEEFKTKVESIPGQQLTEMAQAAISELCKTGGQSFTMSAPPSIQDTDIILSEVVRRFEVWKPVGCQHNWLKSHSNHMLYCGICGKYKPEGS